MQRSLTHKRTLAPFIYALIFIVYIGLSSIYIVLPPLFSILYIYFSDAMKKNDAIDIAIISFCLIIFEAEKGYLLFSSIIYFILLYRFVVPKLKQTISCKSCVKFLTVFFIYIGFYLFSMLLSNVFLFELPMIDYYVIYYIIVEFLVVSIL
jgi:hypothetical protein